VSFRLDFSADGEQLFARHLLDVVDRGQDATPAFERIADDFMGYEKLRFDTDGYGTWAPLQPSTIAEKARKGLDPRVLRATGELHRSLTERGDPHQELHITPDFMLFGSNVEYARFHQRGEGVPQRRPLGFTETQKRDTVRVLQRYLVTGAV
jgi:phage gpG-like protein